MINKMKGINVKDLVIIGAGGFGREVAALVEEINEFRHEWNFLGFIDDRAAGVTVEGYPILGTTEDLLKMEPKPYVSIAVADAAVREWIANRCLEAKMPIATLIHPNVAQKGKLCTVGQGSIVCDGVLMAANSHIGDFCIVNFRCVIGHDTVVEDYVGMMSETHLAGDIHIGKACYFGLRCTVINLVEITDHCTFGACSCVVKNVTEPGTYVGVPAKLIKPLKK